MGKDRHDEGQRDASRDSGSKSFADVACDQILGGKYNPPSDHKGREEYKSGWVNTKSQIKRN